MTLKVAITADPELPVPPRLYGGIERMISMLIGGLKEHGYEVTLFAHSDSSVPCHLQPYPNRRSRSCVELFYNIVYVSRYLFWNKFDLIHSFGRLAYLLPTLPSGLPKLMSYQRHISPRSVRIGDLLSRGRLQYTGCSASLIRQYRDRPNWHVVYNGVPTAQYTFQPGVANDAPLVFLGRVEALKGPHTAINVARRSNRRLIIAGNVPPEAHRYFAEYIEPWVDGQQIMYVGAVDDRHKNDLLGQSAALLMPIEWEEPFGIVMAEALACGTPVIGFRRGAVPEVVQDGINGFVCDTCEDMLDAVTRMHTLDRHACRLILEERFSDQAIIQGYERLYKAMLQ